MKNELVSDRHGREYIYKNISQNHKVFIQSEEKLIYPSLQNLSKIFYLFVFLAITITNIGYIQIENIL